MSRISWEVARLLEWRGWWLAALAGLIFSLAYHVLAIVPAMKQHTEATARHASMLAKAAAPDPALRVAANSQAPVYAALPSFRTLPQWLSLIFSTAKELDVLLDMGDYRYVRNGNEPYGRYQIDLPVYADYPTVRRFSARLMNRMPFAVLDDLSMVREDAASDVVEARLRLTLYLSEQ